MDPSPVSSHNFPVLLFLGLFSTLLLGIIIGFYILFPILNTKVGINSTVITYSNNNSSSKQTNDFTLPPEIIKYLENPILTNWAIRIEGTIVSKLDNSLTIEHDSDQITMLVDQETTFKTITSSASTARSISFQEVKVGDPIQGSATVQYANGELKIKGLVLGVGQ